MSEDSCIRCGSNRRVEGYLLDRQRNLQSNEQEWIEGTPERAWHGGMKIRKVAHGPVVAHRCAKCGHLELSVPKIES